MIINVYLPTQIYNNQHLNIWAENESWSSWNKWQLIDHIYINKYKNHIINNVNKYLAIQISNSKHLRIWANKGSSNLRLSF
jgi:hypothetical protein